MNATADVRALIDTLRFNDDVLNVAMTDMTDELAYRQLRDGGPSIAWTMGHMLHHRNQIAAAVGCTKPALDLDRFQSAATDGQGYPTVQQLQAAWAEFSTRFVSALSRLSPGDLNVPSPIRLPHGEETLLDALRFVVWHEGYHLGQTALLRSHHGLTPVVTLILERVAVAP